MTARRRSPTRALPAAAVALVLMVGLVVASGCGIPTDDAPRPLAEESSTTAPPASEPLDSDDSVTLFFSTAETSDRLVSTTRGLDGDATPQAVLEALLAGPLEEETDEGLITLIPAGTEGVVLVEADLATIAMSSEWESLTSGSTDAYAQVVLTVTRNVPGVERVTFRVGRQVVQAPTPDAGTLDVVSAADYADFAPP